MMTKISSPSHYLRAPGDNLKSRTSFATRSDASHKLLVSCHQLVWVDSGIMLTLRCTFLEFAGVLRCAVRACRFFMAVFQSALLSRCPVPQLVCAVVCFAMGSRVCSARRWLVMTKFHPPLTASGQLVIP
jgi:hypothetical protein